jgi:hypothetical protein
VNLGLEHYYGDFNVVNARLIAAGVSHNLPFIFPLLKFLSCQIKDYKTFVDHIAKVLRPGGLISLGEVYFSPFDTDHKPLIVGTTIIQPPWLPLWVALLTASMNARGAATSVAADLVRLVEEHGAFEHIVAKTHFIPISPSAKGDDPEAIRQRKIGEYGRDDTIVGSSFVAPYRSYSHALIAQALIHSTRPLLLARGLSPTLVDQLRENSIKELMDAKPYYMKYQTVYALKKHPVTDRPSTVPATMPATGPEEDIVME